MEWWEYGMEYGATDMKSMDGIAMVYNYIEHTENLVQLEYIQSSCRILSG